MQSMKSHLTKIVANAFESCGYDASYGEVVESQRPDLGQFQCNGALPAAGRYKKNPREIAQSVVAKIIENEMFSDVSIAGPGFINLTISDDALATCIRDIASDNRSGAPHTDKPRRVVVDFGGPNAAKPMHVGHLRSSIIGDSLQRLYSFMGDNVISDIHLGDWGTQMGMLICELQREQPELPYFDPEYEGPYPKEPPVSIADLSVMYPAANARCKNDENEMRKALEATVDMQSGRPGYRALWKHFKDLSIMEMKEDFSKLGVSFDYWYGESDYHDKIPAMLDRLKSAKKAVVSDGALVVPLDSEDKDMPPLILVKSDGGYLYGTTDMATLLQRVEDFDADLVLYVVDKRQSLHFEQVFKAAKKTGLAGDTEFEHVGFGTVNGPDGKPFKTRAGGVMRLRDLIDIVVDEAERRMREIGVGDDYGEEERLDTAKKVGIAALKFADLINHRLSDYIFDVEKFTRFEGKTGPYLLYTAVRIKSILRKADERGITKGAIIEPKTLDRDVMLALTKLPESVIAAYDGYAPNHLCEYVYNLAQTINRFYRECHILAEEDKRQQGSWLTLLEVCLRQMELVLDLLGIEVPERM